jgi:pyruvate/2-oxoglutarate dehydrogenase complex dihydrolipoamide acyltransferase (E2) component
MARHYAMQALERAKLAEKQKFRAMEKRKRLNFIDAQIRKARDAAAHMLAKKDMTSLATENVIIINVSTAAMAASSGGGAATTGAPFQKFDTEASTAPQAQPAHGGISKKQQQQSRQQAGQSKAVYSPNLRALARQFGVHPSRVKTGEDPVPDECGDADADWGM